MGKLGHEPLSRKTSPPEGQMVTWGFRGRGQVCHDLCSTGSSEGWEVT